MGCRFWSLFACLLATCGLCRGATIIDFEERTEGFSGSATYTHPGSGTVLTLVSPGTLAFDHGAATPIRPLTNPGIIVTANALSFGGGIALATSMNLDVTPGVTTNVFTFDYIAAVMSMTISVTGYDASNNRVASVTDIITHPTGTTHDAHGPTITSSAPFARIEIRPNAAIAYDNFVLDVPEPAGALLGGIFAMLHLAGRRRTGRGPAHAR